MNLRDCVFEAIRNGIGYFGGIRDYVRERYGPVSDNSIWYHLKKLVEEGEIERRIVFDNARGFVPRYRARL